MADYHTIAIIKYPSVQKGIEDASAHNIWNREYNFISGTETNSFYYDWIRVIKILRTFFDYLMKENFKGDRRDLPYTIKVNSNLPFGRYAFEGIRIRVERLGSSFNFSSNFRIPHPTNGNTYPLESSMPQIGLSYLYNTSIETFWSYYNTRIDMLGLWGYGFKNRCVTLAQHL